MHKSWISLQCASKEPLAFSTLLCKCKRLKSASEPLWINSFYSASGIVERNRCFTEMWRALSHFVVLQFVDTNLVEPTDAVSLDLPYLVHLVCFPLSVLWWAHWSCILPEDKHDQTNHSTDITRALHIPSSWDACTVLWPTCKNHAFLPFLLKPFHTYMHWITIAPYPAMYLSPRKIT